MSPPTESALGWLGGAQRPGVQSVRRHFVISWSPHGTTLTVHSSNLSALYLDLLVSGSGQPALPMEDQKGTNAQACLIVF